MGIEDLTNKIPDVHFDWYARFIPGCVGVFAYFLITENVFIVSSSNLILYGFIGYLIGHFIQPIVGYLVKIIENKISSDPTNKYAKAKADPNNKSLVSKVCKAHSEANSMLASCLILVALLIKLEIINYWVIGVASYLFMMAIERIHARKRKINDLPE